jgi:hypothetical protein
MYAPLFCDRANVSVLFFYTLSWKKPGGQDGIFAKNCNRKLSDLSVFQDIKTKI